MKTISKEDLTKIFNREIKFLIDGVSNTLNPYHFFYLSTFNDNEVSLRTIVLRKIDKNPFSIYFNADYRSPKIEQLSFNDSCSILFYDNKRKIQLRAKCKAFINNNNKISKIHWDKTPLQSRKCYMGVFKPSEILKEWHPNFPLKYLKCDPEKSDSESGYENFTIVKLIVKKIDVLELHHDGHIRFTMNSMKKINYIAP